MPSVSPYDWAADEQFGARSASAPVPHARQGGEVVPRQTVDVNLVTGHALDCECSRCPGWYSSRASAAQSAERWSGASPVVPAARKANALLDQVVPVAVLMAVFTMCMSVLLPVMAPVFALTTVAIVGMVVAIVALAVVVLVFVGVARRVGGHTPGAQPKRTVMGSLVKSR